MGVGKSDRCLLNVLVDVLKLLQLDVDIMVLNAYLLDMQNKTKSLERCSRMGDVACKTSLNYVLEVSKVKLLYFLHFGVQRL